MGIGQSTPVKTKRIGVFGGTFDPIHLGHLIIASELKHAVDLACVLFVPAGRPPHKTDQSIGNDDHRLAMLHLALDGTPGFAISTVDLERPGPSYTTETLKLLSQINPDAELIFLMGEDSLRDFPTWHKPERIVEQAEVAVATRPGIESEPSDVYEKVPNARGRIHMVEVPEIGISSREVRRRASEGLPISYLVPREVEMFILEHGLYRD